MDDVPENQKDPPIQPEGSLLPTILEEYEAFTGRRIDRETYMKRKRAISTDVVPISEADRS